MKKSSRVQIWVKTTVGIVMMLAMMSVFTVTSLADSAGQITATSAKIRKEPSTTSETIGSAEKGAAVSVKGQTQGSDGYTWYQVVADANSTGYIRGDLMKITDGSTPAQLNSSSSATTTTTSSTPTTSTPDESVVDVTEVEPVSGSVSGGSPVRVRQNASTTSRILSTAQSGMQLTVIGTATGTDNKAWYQIRVTSGSTETVGFIRAEYVSVDGELVPVEAEPTQPAQEQTPEVPEEPEETKDWDTVYEGGVWHLVDNVNDQSYDIQKIFSSVEANSKTLNDTLKSNKTQQVIVVILCIIMVVMAAVISFLIFKIKDLSDAEYFNEVERETTRRRAADRPVENPRNRQRVMQSVGAEGRPRPAGTRPAGAGGSGQRPAGAGSNGQRPAGAGSNGQRPAGTGGSGQRPAGTGSNGQRPVGTGSNGQRPAGAGGSGQRPAGAGAGRPRPAGTRPAGAGGSGQRPVATGGSRPRPAAAGGENAPRPVKREAEYREAQDEFDSVFEQDLMSEEPVSEKKTSAGKREKEGWKPKNFADDEFEFQFLDWDGEEQE